MLKRAQRKHRPRRHRVTAPDSLIAYTYGAAGCTSCGGGDLPASVSRTDSQGSQNIAYSYDGSLLLTSTWSGPVAGVVARTYDNDFRVSSWSVNGGTAITQTYDADGALTKAGDLNLTYNASTGFLTGVSLGVTNDAYQYSTYGETASYAATAGGSAVYEVSYTRDSLGRIESENEIVEGVSTQWAYRYDAAGRLVEVLKDGASWSVYRYDSNGNRIEAATQAGLVNGTYDAQDRLLTYGNFAYEYTANGELKTKTDTMTGSITRYTYDVFGNLTRVDLPDGRVIEYVIDGANRRVGKKVNGVLVKGWLYKDSLKPIAELDGSGNVVATFVYGSKYNTPDYAIKGGVTYRIISDHLGSPRLIVNSASGAIIARIDYDEFGNVLANTNPEFSPFGFAGGIYDTDTGLIRFGARDYDPITGRWTAKDPIGFEGGDTNLYGYILADPINHVDSNGLDWVNDAANFSAGFGDAITFGGTDWIRERFEGSNIVDKCSDAYSRGKYTGYLLGTGLGGLRGATWFGGTRFGHFLNHNKYIRIGPGRMPANGELPPGTHVPRLAFGSKPGGPHFDLRVRPLD